MQDSDGSIPTFGKFESSKATYLNNLKSDRFKQPRMFTMEQIRNMVFALMDQSTINDRIKLNEHKYVSVYQTGLRLAEMDSNIQERSNEMHETITYEVAKFREEYEGLKRDNEGKIRNHQVLIDLNKGTIAKHKEELQEHKH